MDWSYGVTTVPSRIDNLLIDTLKSLATGGFDRPHIFIDGARVPPSSLDTYECTCHSKQLRTAAHWAITAWELYVLNPIAERYAIFQDDLLCYSNLRNYLESSKYPRHGYWNLYTFPSNEHGKGWHLSNQRGLGAVALVFDNEALRTLFLQPHFVNRPMDPKRGHKSIDGGIVEAFKKVHYAEWVHSPSLTFHTGDASSMGNRQHPRCMSFLGSDFDACELLKECR